MAERRSKSNKKFMVLSALGILMVVDHHTWIAFDLFGNYIPYNSFFMPMFVFISGYFNRVDGSTKILPYILKKIKTLLVPYVCIAAAVFGLQWLMDLYKTGTVPAYPEGYLKYMFDMTVTVGAPFALVTPMWFVISLFSTLILYAMLKKVLAKIWNSYVMFILFTGLHLLVVYLAKNVEPDLLTDYLLPLKCLFFLPFIEMGIIYRDRLEKKHSALPGGLKIVLMFMLLLINMIRTIKLPQPYDVAFDSIGDLSGFTSPYIVTPLISSVIGILFWLTFVDLIGKPVYESRFVNYISCNTFFIMGFHIAFFNVLNCILLAVNDNLVKLPYFDADYFRMTEWYFWEISLNIKLIYLIVGILGPLGIKWVWDRLYGQAAKMIIKNKT